MLQNYIFGLIASILILPTAVLAGENPIVIKTTPVNKPACSKTNPAKVATGTPQNVSVTQHRVVRSAGANRTEIYQSTTSTTSSTSTSTVSTIPSVCVLPQAIMNNVLITP